MREGVWERVRMYESECVCTRASERASERPAARDTERGDLGQEERKTVECGIEDVCYVCNMM